MARNQLIPPVRGKTSGNLRFAVRCRFCKSKNIIKKGFRKTEKRGKIQKFLCKECNRFFCVDNGFWRMRNHHRIITMVIDCYFDGLSSRKLKRILWRHHNLQLSHVSVLDWVRRYSQKVKQFVDNLPVKLGGYYFSDETVVLCEGTKKWFWITIDDSTRFIVSSHFSTTRSNKDAFALVHRAVKRQRPHTYQTDGFAGYRYGIRKHFFRRGKGKKKYYEGVKYIRNVVSKTNKFNTKIERVFGHIKDRIKAMRGFKNEDSARIILQGLVTHLNFVHYHRIIGMTPSQKAEIKLDLKQNKWLELIRLFSIS